MKIYSPTLSIKYHAGVIISLIKPFKECKKKEDILFDGNDEYNLSHAKKFLEKALIYGPYEKRSVDFNLLLRNLNKEEMEFTHFVFNYLTNKNIKNSPIDLRDLKLELQLYISWISRIEQWQVPEPNEKIYGLEELDNFWRDISYRPTGQINVSSSHGFGLQEKLA